MGVDTRKAEPKSLLNPEYFQIKRITLFPEKLASDKLVKDRVVTDNWNKSWWQKAKTRTLEPFWVFPNGGDIYDHDVPADENYLIRDGKLYRRAYFTIILSNNDKMYEFYDTQAEADERYKFFTEETEIEFIEVNGRYV